MSDSRGFASRLFISGSLAFVLIGILGSLYGVSLPVFTRTFGLAEGEAGLVLTTNAAGAVIAVLAATLGAPGLGARTALAMMAAGTAGVALMVSWPATLAASVVIGAGFGLIATEVNRSFLAGFGSRGPGMVGLVNGISGLGLVAGPLLFVWSGGRVALVFGGMAVLAAVLIFVYARDVATRQTAGSTPSFRQWRTGILGLNHLSVCLEASLAGLGATALIASGWSEQGAATLAAGFFTTFLIARLSLYWVTRIVPADLLFLAGAVGTGLSAAVAAAGFPAIGFVASGAFVGLAFPAFFVWGARLLGETPQMSAAMLLSGLSGLAIGPFVMGLILADIGMEQLFACIAVGAAVLSLAILLTIIPARRAIARPIGT